MIKRIETIAADLAALLREGGLPQDALPADIDPGTPLHRYVVLLFPDILAQKILDLPSPCSDTVPFDGKPVWDSPWGGYLTLPDDFLRLGEFRLEDSPRPLVTLTDGPLGRAIRWFGSRAYGTSPRLTYTPRPRFDPFGGIQVPKECYLPTLEELITKL